jgi:hypothetical protein
MVTVEALHALTAELHAGFLTLAFVCIMIVAGCQIVVRLRNRMPKSFVRIAIRIRGYMEAAGFVGAVLGVLGLLLSAWTGMYAWTLDALINDPVIRNKILLTAFATVLWAGVVFIRSRYGRGLWTCPAMASLYVVLTFVAFGMIGTVGSMGAHLAQGGSALDPIWSLVGFRVDTIIELSTNAAALLALVSVALLVVALAIARKYDLFSVKLGAETCQKYFKWDEPVIVVEAPAKP